MVVKRGEGSFPNVYRPCRISEVIGQEEAKKIIQKGLDEENLSQALLFHGTSGCGKTTFARIIALGLNCEKGPTSEPCCECESCKSILVGRSMDFQEINAANFTGVDDTRKKIQELGFGTMGARARVVIFDECHMLSKEAQTALLKPVEDSKSGNYVIFCSTSPDKIIDTLRNRCVQLEFKKVSSTELEALLTQVCQRENLQYDKAVIEKVISESDGMPRKALLELSKAVSSGKLKPAGEIKTISGRSNVLVLAPHGVYGDDDFTGVIAEELANKLGCFAVINEKYKRNSVDLNTIEEAEEHAKEEFLDPILEYTKRIAEEHGEVVILHIHGIDDANIKAAGKQLGLDPSELDALIGYGQREPGEERFTASREKIIDPLIERLKENQIKAAIAPIKAIEGRDGELLKYTGWNKNSLNQLFKTGGYPNGRVQSMQLEIKKSGFRDNTEVARQTGSLLADAFRKLQNREPVFKEVDIAKIQVETDEDRKYIFRVILDGPNEYQRRQEADIEALAVSIMNNDLQHPLVLLQKANGNYKILCGFRRYKALKKLVDSGEALFKKVHAKIYQEDDLTDEQCMRISLAENSERVDLNPIEIGGFLQAVKDLYKTRGKKCTNNYLVSRFGPYLGIGTTAANVSQYLKLYRLSLDGKSKELIDDLFAHRLKFRLALALASIKDDGDRESFYKQAVKPLRLNRSQVFRLKMFFDMRLANTAFRNKYGENYQAVLSHPEIKDAINKAAGSEESSWELIRQIYLLIGDPQSLKENGFAGMVDSFREDLPTGSSSAEDFSVTASPGMKNPEITISIKIRKEGLDDAIELLKTLSEKKQKITELIDYLSLPPNEIEKENLGQLSKNQENP